jgi:dTDP-4-dehydrorhamnose reductase
MKVLITGGNGQLGWELQRAVPAGVQAVAVGRQELDITNPNTIERLFKKTRPAVVINTAAYTAVDKAEQEKELAYAVNAQGAANIARAAMEHGAQVIHISTDFVFDGKKSRPYLPEDTPGPINVYGASKLEGERLVNDICGGRVLIIRTAWVYSSHGSNFVRTILRLINERDRLNIVDDQIGTPTWAKGLANTVWKAIERGLTGVYHWTDAGVASWYDFAVAIQEEALDLGLVKRAIPIVPIRTEDFSTSAQRPAYSVLEKKKLWSEFNQIGHHWREGLRAMLALQEM